MKLLDKKFFSRDSVLVAKDLLGKIIFVNGKKCRIVETEAYGCDKASHGFKKTSRSSLMWDSFGKVYVYLIYGMYYCLNFTCNCSGVGAVLIRAVEPINFSGDCSGPGKLCSELKICKKFNGSEINDLIKVYDIGEKVDIVKAKRIGIKEDKNLLWRFYIRGNVFVSRK